MGGVLEPDLKTRITGELREQLSPRHVPDRILDVRTIPYNRAGKKLEVAVKRLLKGEPRESVVAEGVLRDPSALGDFERIAAQLH